VGNAGNGAQGGPGGLSLGIGYLGTAPTIDGTSVSQATTQTGITTGTAGIGGTMGVGGPPAAVGLGQPGADGTAGTDGISRAVQSL
jgi:hypothetical protein